MAERVGFEPTCPLRDKTLSRRPRYDHFGTSPQRNQWCRTFYFTRSTRLLMARNRGSSRYLEIATIGARQRREISRGLCRRTPCYDRSRFAARPRR